VTHKYKVTARVNKH